MTSDRFKELVNLYLDGRIGREAFQQLLKETSHNPTRRELFQSYYQLHKGVQLALNPRFRERTYWHRILGLGRVFQAAAACLLLVLGIGAFQQVDRHTDAFISSAESSQTLQLSTAAPSLVPSLPQQLIGSSDSPHDNAFLTAAPFNRAFKEDLRAIRWTHHPQLTSLPLQFRLRVEKGRKNADASLPVRFENLSSDRFAQQDIPNGSVFTFDAYKALYH